MICVPISQKGVEGWPKGAVLANPAWYDFMLFSLIYFIAGVSLIVQYKVGPGTDDNQDPVMVSVSHCIIVVETPTIRGRYSMHGEDVKPRQTRNDGI